MSKEWKQTIFKPEDFEGAGQYIVRELRDKETNDFISDTGGLSTLMKKVGYSNSVRHAGKKSNYLLIDMSDGLVVEGYFTNTETESGERIETDKWIWNEFSGDTSFEAKSRLCEYLNNNPHKETFRFATNEELIRVAAYQKWRTK